MSESLNPPNAVPNAKNNKALEKAAKLGVANEKIKRNKKSADNIEDIKNLTNEELREHAGSVDRNNTPLTNELEDALMRQANAKALLDKVNEETREFHRERVDYNKEKAAKDRHWNDVGKYQYKMDDKAHLSIPISTRGTADPRMAGDIARHESGVKSTYKTYEQKKQDELDKLYNDQQAKVDAKIKQGPTNEDGLQFKDRLENIQRAVNSEYQKIKFTDPEEAKKMVKIKEHLEASIELANLDMNKLSGTQMYTRRLAEVSAQVRGLQSYVNSDFREAVEPFMTKPAVEPVVVKAQPAPTQAQVQTQRAHHYVAQARKGTPGFVTVSQTQMVPGPRPTPGAAHAEEEVTEKKSPAAMQGQGGFIGMIIALLTSLFGGGAAAPAAAQNNEQQATPGNTVRQPGDKGYDALRARSGDLTPTPAAGQGVVAQRSK